jgi:hypothetical protein
MADSQKTGIGDVLTITALALLLWWFFHKKKKPVVKVEAKEANVDIKVNGDPEFNLNDYCQNIVYKPLSLIDLRPAEMLGEGWCNRGDCSIVDPEKGFGDDYADEQAKKYVNMKQDEALRINNMLCVQFHLINTSPVAITTDLLNTTQNPAVFDSAPAAPSAIAASARSDSGFTANWNIVTRAIGYYLDISTDPDFLTFVPGFQNLDVGNVTSYVVNGLAGSTQYYYQVRCYDSSETSVSSNIIPVTTKYNDWFLASKDSMNGMFVELKSHGIGGFANLNYSSSSEINAFTFWQQHFGTGVQSAIGKGSIQPVRACRTFTSTTVYALRDIGPAGGWIFNIVDLGDSLYSYLEAAPTDLSDNQWSNIPGQLIGTTGTAIGTGQANTMAIIGQAGHTDSAAKDCNDLII